MSSTSHTSIANRMAVRRRKKAQGPPTKVETIENKKDDVTQNGKVSKKTSSSFVIKLLWGAAVGTLLAVAIGLTRGLALSRNETTSKSEIDDPSTKQQGTDSASTRSLSQLTSIGGYELLETVPHDTKAFTQGLQMINKTHCFESTGIYGESQVRVVDVKMGAVLLKQDLENQFFGEGLTYYTDANTKQGRLIVITWKEQTAFLYDPISLTVLDNFTYSTTTTEGWGITYVPHSHEFIVSDGSQYLHVWDAANFQEKQRIPVTMKRKDMMSAVEIQRINELEWDSFTSTIFANVWFQNVVIRIDPDSGFVSTIYDLQSLFTNRPPGTDVLNGIALTDTANEIWVTGKYWPNMYRIRLLEPRV